MVGFRVDGHIFTHAASTIIMYGSKCKHVYMYAMHASPPGSVVNLSQRPKPLSGFRKRVEYWFSDLTEMSCFTYDIRPVTLNFVM